MVAKITTGKDIYGALAYNQQKVDKGEGAILSTSGLLEPEDGCFTVADTAAQILSWMPAHVRTEKPVIHISLNPDPKDALSDEVLADIADEYMEGMGWGGQPYIVYKHTDIDRTHVHIVSVQVDSTGRKINDSHRNERSVALTERIEREYGLDPAKGRKNMELWQLKPVDYEKGDLKRQIAAVVKPVLSMYRFQTMGELRALLSLYRIGMEEVEGTHGGRNYRGLVYTALDENGEKAPAPPLKASRLGEDASLEKIMRVMECSGEKIETGGLRKSTRRRVREAMEQAQTEEVFRKRLKERHIDLYLRRNDTGRITGVTFIDHETRCVLNGSRLGKQYSANALNERLDNKIQGSENSKSKQNKNADLSSVFLPQPTTSFHCRIMSDRSFTQPTSTCKGSKNH